MSAPPPTFRGIVRKTPDNHRASAEHPLLIRRNVDIRFTSSLTADDENRIAPALLGAMVSILNLLPIAYVLRIDTADASVFQHSGSPPEPSVPLSPPQARSEGTVRRFDRSPLLEPTNLGR